jgi:TRAP-type C4-dicarboxylate transport system permease small subunit
MAVGKRFSEMNASMRKIGLRLGRWAEHAVAAMLAIMFIAFIIQIAFRYLLNLPTGWTTEITILAWLWLVLWGAAFVVRENEEIRFDLVYGAAGPQLRRVLAILSALGLLTLYIMSLPAVVDYVTFMKVQRSAYLGIRFDYIFSIYIIFALAAIVRYGWILWSAIRGPAPDDPPPGEVGR